MHSLRAQLDALKSAVVNKAAYLERQTWTESLSDDARRKKGVVLDPYLSIARAYHERLEAAIPTMTLVADFADALGSDERALDAIRRGIERARAAA